MFGGHPTISPLVAMVAGEYRAPRYAESGAERPPAQVRIYQSTVWREQAPESTMLMFHLGMADIEWIDGDPDEVFQASHVDHPGAPRSLELMRGAMLSREEPDCMVTLGGMEGVTEEARLYRSYFPNRKIYALARTGGASALLRAELGGAHVDLIDERIISEIPRSSTEGDSGEGAARRAIDRRRELMARHTIPYPLIVQKIVEELADSSRLREF